MLPSQSKQNNECRVEVSQNEGLEKQERVEVSYENANMVWKRVGWYLQITMGEKPKRREQKAQRSNSSEPGRR